MGSRAPWTMRKLKASSRSDGETLLHTKVQARGLMGSQVEIKTFPQGAARHR